MAVMGWFHLRTQFLTMVVNEIGFTSLAINLLC